MKQKYLNKKETPVLKREIVTKKVSLGSSLRKAKGSITFSKKIEAPFKIHASQKRLILDPFNEWLGKGSTRGMFLGFRKCGKTDLITIYSVAQWIFKDPLKTVIIMTRKMDRARAIVRQIGDLLKIAGLKGDFGQDQIRLNSKKQPTVLALTVNSTTKGWHADLLICDDPVEPSDEYSTALKRRVERVYEETKNIATKVFVIGQYVAIDDIYVKLNGVKKVQTFSFWIGDAPKSLIKILELDLEDLKNDLPTYGKNYEGVFYPNKENPFAQILKGHYGTNFTYGLLDPSDGKNDYSAFVYLKDFGDFVAIKGKMYKNSWVDAMAFEKNEIDQLYRFYYEENTIGSIGHKIFKEFTKTPCYGFRTQENKVHKILSLVPFVKNQRVRLDLSSDEEFIRTILNWNPKMGNNQVDDGIDALSMIIKQLGLYYEK